MRGTMLYTNKINTQKKKETERTEKNPSASLKLRERSTWHKADAVQVSAGTGSTNVTQTAT